MYIISVLGPADFFSIFYRLYYFSIIVLAGDVSPVDVISFMPVVCEEAGIPYCYIPTKEVIENNNVS